MCVWLCRDRGRRSVRKHTIEKGSTRQAVWEGHTHTHTHTPTQPSLVQVVIPGAGHRSYEDKPDVFHKVRVSPLWLAHTGSCTHTSGRLGSVVKPATPAPICPHCNTVHVT